MFETKAYAAKLTKKWLRLVRAKLLSAKSEIKYIDSVEQQSELKSPVVSTVVSGIIFARFSTVEYVPTI